MPANDRISRCTAANTLVFIGASATDLLAAFPPYFDSGTAGINPLMTTSSTTVTCNAIATSGTDYYHSFIWPTSMAVKRIHTYVSAAYTGGTSNLYARIYQVNSSGRPGKLLVDFGVLGTGGSSLASAATVQSAAHCYRISTNPWRLLDGLARYRFRRFRYTRTERHRAP